MISRVIIILGSGVRVPLPLPAKMTTSRPVSRSSPSAVEAAFWVLRCRNSGPSGRCYGYSGLSPLPIEVVVLNCWVTETNDTPWVSNSSTSLAKSASDRVRRSTL